MTTFLFQSKQRCGMRIMFYLPHLVDVSLPLLASINASPLFTYLLATARQSEARWASWRQWCQTARNCHSHSSVPVVRVSRANTNCLFMFFLSFFFLLVFPLPFVFITPKWQQQRQQINLRLILVSGKTKEFLFSPSDSAGDIALTVFENWPDGKFVYTYFPVFFLSLFMNANRIIIG